MKYRYEIIDEGVKANLSVLEEEKIQEEIREHMKDDADCIALNISPGIYVSFPKSIVKKFPVYDPDGWNLFPEVIPPKEGKYIVQRGSRHIEESYYITVDHWDRTDNYLPIEALIKSWEIFNTLAFREFPKMLEKEVFLDRKLEYTSDFKFRLKYLTIFSLTAEDALDQIETALENVNQNDVEKALSEKVFYFKLVYKASEDCHKQFLPFSVCIDNCENWNEFWNWKKKQLETIT